MEYVPWISKPQNLVYFIVKNWMSLSFPVTQLIEQVCTAMLSDYVTLSDFVNW